MLRQPTLERNDKAIEAFDSLKNAMMSLLILRLPDLSNIFNVTKATSVTCIGAVLSQQDQPISFFSKKVCPCMQASSTYI